MSPQRIMSEVDTHAYSLLISICILKDVAVPKHVTGGTRLFVRINKEQNVIFKWQALHSQDVRICIFKYSEIHIAYISYVDTILHFVVINLVQ